MDSNRSVFSKYRKIIFAVILFMVADAIVIGINFYNTFKADESAVSINLSGRQRMMSQRMTKALLTLGVSMEAGDEDGIKTSLKELTLAVRRFDRTLMGFRDGAMVTGGDDNPVYLTQVGTEKSRQFVAETYVIWKPYMEHLKPLLNSDRDSFSDNYLNATKLEDPARLEDAKKRFQAEENFTDEEFRRKLEYIASNPEQFKEELRAAVAFALEKNPTHSEPQNNRAVLKLMNALTTDLEQVASHRAAILRIVLVVGIVFALINFGYTVIISIRDLMAGDRKLSEARQETIEILATVREGLFLLDKNKKIGTQFSESLPDILRREIVPDSDFLPHLEAIAPRNIYEAAVDYIDLLLGDRVKEALVVSLNPLINVPILVTDPRANTQTRYLSFFFNRVLSDDQQISHLLVTVQDVTDKVVLTQQIEQAKNLAKIEVETLLRLASSDFEALQRFIDNVGKSLAQINEKMSAAHDEARDRLHTLNYIMRIMHGIKGEAAVLGIEALESYAHSCEEELVSMREDEQSLSGDQMLRVAVLLEGFYQRHSSLAQIVARLGNALGKTQPSGGMPDGMTAQKHPFADHIAALAQRIAADHGKQVEVSCQFEKFFSLPKATTKELQDISIQLVRNAMTHGIEMPDERTQHNKPSIGALSLWCEYLGHGQYTFTVRDDGCGIVPDRLRKHFVKKNILTAAEADALSDQEIANRIFQPGVSTVEVADQDSGHGIGLDAVLEKVRGMGGYMLVKSRPNQFTEFNIQFSTVL
ncbi:MAG: type IV pili methyl-accepting chemotaxis transducer N-terminal domain-containing protein [Azoarcus sp.]|jgi:signal transduction histidine kinase|nr:type IV pili methyl-accepting chemotaxis transducer N-terminal domain-containing protein [Azoarcus sp.]